MLNTYIVSMSLLVLTIGASYSYTYPPYLRQVTQF